MPISRRKFFIASAIGPFLPSCATDLSSFSKESVAALAARLNVTAAYVAFCGADASAPVMLSSSSGTHASQSKRIFQAASLTKPVIAFVALKLAVAGKLDLGAPVSHYLPGGYRHRQRPLFSISGQPEFDLVKPDILARIPVATLLNHSSGLPNWASGAISPEFPAGERWQYSGEAYVLLQALISALTGQDIESWVKEHVFDPLGMRHSRLRISDDIREQLVDSASRLPRRFQLEFTEPNAAASLYTTAEDYAKLISALLRDRALLAMTLADPITTDHELGLSWGRGWGIEAAAGGPYLWQWGNNPGYRAFAMVSATSGNGFVLLTNSDSGLPLAASLAQATVPAEHGVFRFGMLG